MALESVPSLTPKQVATELEAGEAIIVDVREATEYQQEHIAGARSRPLSELNTSDFPPDKAVVLYCGAGKRSCQAAGRLREMGRTDIAILDGGIVGWKHAGLPTQRALAAFSSEEIKAAVADRYGKVAKTPDQKFNFPVGRAFAESVGYEPRLLDQLPRGLWESFTGAGNPQPFVDARAGEVLLDLGCGAGLDLCLYASMVGVTGRVFGLDLSYDMIDKAQVNLASVGVTNVSWLHAPADAIPLDCNSVDLVTANGIYNLSPDKDAVMREVARVLKPGGRTIFAEVVLKSDLPADARNDVNDWFRCIGGALVQEDLLARLERCGFARPEILWSGRNARTGHELAVSAVIRATKAR